MLVNGETVRIRNSGPDIAQATLLGGGTVRGDVLFSGPFMMDTPERLAQAKRDFAAG